MKQKQAEGNSIYLHIMCQRRVSWSHGLKGCHVHRAERVLCSCFLFVTSPDRSVVTLMVTRREMFLKI